MSSASKRNGGGTKPPPPSLRDQLTDAERVIGILQEQLEENSCCKNAAPIDYFNKYYRYVPAPDQCPSCHTSLDNGPIPAQAAFRSYGPPYRFLRSIAIYDQAQDRTTHFRCPDCNHEWPR